NRERSTQRRLVPNRQEHVDLARRELAIVLFVAFDIQCLDVIEGKIPAFLIAQFGHPLEEICIKWGLSRLRTDRSDGQHLGLQLRAHGGRPCSRGATEQRDDVAATDMDCHVTLPWEVMPMQWTDDTTFPSPSVGQGR